VVALVAAALRVVGNMAFLTEAERTNVEAAVARAEAGTAGELVVVVSDRSSDYAAVRATVAASLTVAAALEAFYLTGGMPSWAFFLGQLPFGFLLYWFLGRGVLLRGIVPARVRSQAVEDRAFSAFVQAGVTDTKGRSGVLIFISQAEHRAVILADRGINEVVAPDEWQKDVDSLVLAIRRGEPAQGLLNAIERIGGILRQAFPADERNENELSNMVRSL
jgi:putative membrane protein